MKRSVLRVVLLLTMFVPISSMAEAYSPIWAVDIADLVEADVWRWDGRNLGSEWWSVLQQWLGQLLSQVSFSSAEVELEATSWRTSADVVLLRGAQLSLVFALGIILLAIREFRKW
ncbi:hypothetical protein [Gilvimarinus chinensis]|uniref:hypothetical protein n=1 Tax=Gilvimarinus chinensis TaxID=396005 RepID=UPI00035F8D2F|nr:hypothetical protein [Gilvimarinus chinensis]